MKINDVGLWFWIRLLRVMRKKYAIEYLREILECAEKGKYKNKKEVIQMAKAVRKGIPKRDGSGRGVGANRGRGGCAKPTGKNKRRK